MSKISIVGVEGSGKTTLMAAFGEKYERPDEYGYSLEPQDERTHSVVHRISGILRSGKWPGVTAHATLNALNWTILRRSGKTVKEVGNLSFLDYAGEVYRLAFGEEHSFEQRRPYQDQIDALKDHVESSDMLVVLMNLSDVINAAPGDPRAQEMIYLTLRLLKFASQTQGGKRIAMAFSQVDKYSDIIEREGGLNAVFRKYLPVVEARFPALELLAVSAVDKTVVDADGNECPAIDAKPTGLDDLMRRLIESLRKVRVDKSMKCVSGLLARTLARLGKTLLKCAYCLGPEWGFWGIYIVIVNYVVSLFNGGKFMFGASHVHLTCAAIVSMVYLGLFFWANYLYNFSDRDDDDFEESDLIETARKFFCVLSYSGMFVTSFILTICFDTPAWFLTGGFGAILSFVSDYILEKQEVVAFPFENMNW